MTGMFKRELTSTPLGSTRPTCGRYLRRTVQRARVVVDSVEACLEEAGDIVIPIKDGLISEDHIYAEIGEIAAGVKTGRQNDDEITLFKSVGIAVQDVAAAASVLENARRLNLGSRIEI